MAQMAALYVVSPETLQEQIENYPYLKKDLKRTAFMGDVFFPEHQRTVFRYLGEPDGTPLADDKPKESQKV